MSPLFTLSLALCLFFFALGVVSLGWPERIQQWMLSFYANTSGWAKWNPLINWMRTSGYIVSLRIVGALAIIAGCIALIAITQGASS